MEVMVNDTMINEPARLDSCALTINPSSLNN